MLLFITLISLIFQSVYGFLSCDGVEIMGNGIMLTQGAGICYEDQEDGSSFALACQSSSTMIQFNYDNAYCDGNPTDAVDYSLILQAGGFSYDITCCTGVPCTYSIQELFKDSCELPRRLVDEPETTSSGPEIEFITDGACQGISGVGLATSFCFIGEGNETVIERTSYIGADNCDGSGITTEITSGDCMDGDVYLLECKVAYDTCTALTPDQTGGFIWPTGLTFPTGFIWPSFDFGSTEPETTPMVVTGEALDIDCDALQYFDTDGGNVQPAGFCSSLGDFEKTGSYYPMCNSATEMVIEYYAASNDCTGDSTTKSVDELMEIVGGEGPSFVCCTGTPCPVVSGTQYILTDCSDISTSVIPAYPLTDTVGVCEDNPPNESEKVTQCGNGQAISKNYTGTGCSAAGSGELVIDLTEGLCRFAGNERGIDFYVKIMIACDEAVDTCPTPSPTEKTPAPTAAPDDDGTKGVDAASQIMILLNIMVGIGMLMMN